jgi:hypothetical protein
MNHLLYMHPAIQHKIQKKVSTLAVVSDLTPLSPPKKASTFLE